MGGCECCSCCTGCLKFFNPTPVAGYSTPKRAVIYSLPLENIRIVTYICFWTMVITAVILSKIIIADSDISASPLKAGFGFNNVCIYWDYDPVRTIIAMVYVFVEVPLLMYIMGSIWRSFLAYKAGRLSKCHMIAEVVLMPIKIILALWFRMIFVVSPWSSVGGHTAGFLGLQIILQLVAYTNFAYHYVLKTDPKVINNPLYYVPYLVFSIIVSLIKIILDIVVVFTSKAWYDPTDPTQANFAWSIDIMWMIANAVIPLIIAIRVRKMEKHMEIVMPLTEDTDAVVAATIEMANAVLASTGGKPATKTTTVHPLGGVLDP